MGGGHASDLSFWSPIPALHLFLTSDRVLASNQTRLSLQIPFEIPCTAFQIRFGRQIKKYFLWWPASLVKGYEAGPRWLHCLELQYIALQLSIVQCQYWPVSASAVWWQEFILHLLWHLYCILYSYAVTCVEPTQPSRPVAWPWSYMYGFYLGVIVLCTFVLYVRVYTCIVYRACRIGPWGVVVLPVCVYMCNLCIFILLVWYTLCMWMYDTCMYNTCTYYTCTYNMCV